MRPQLDSPTPPLNLQLISTAALDDVRQAHVDGHLSDIQMEIFEFRIQHPRTATHQQLLSRFDNALSGCGALRRCIKRTVLLLRWEPHGGGGADCYLSPPDEARLHEQLLEAADNIQCMRTRDALNFATVLKQERCEKVKRLLISALEMPALAEEVEYSPPSETWLRQNKNPIRNFVFVGNGASCAHKGVERWTCPIRRRLCSQLACICMHSQLAHKHLSIRL
jgi:hypothetical protein